MRRATQTDTTRRGRKLAKPITSPSADPNAPRVRKREKPHRGVLRYATASSQMGHRRAENPHSSTATSNPPQGTHHSSARAKPPHCMAAKENWIRRCFALGHGSPISNSEQEEHVARRIADHIQRNTHPPRRPAALRKRISYTPHSYFDGGNLGRAKK